MNVGEVRVARTEATATPWGMDKKEPGGEVVVGSTGREPVDGFTLSGTVDGGASATVCPSQDHAPVASSGRVLCLCTPTMPLAGLGSTGPALAVTRAIGCSLEEILESASPTFLPDDSEVTAQARPAPPPVLPRPVLFVHGYNSGTWVFNAMSKWMEGPDGTTNPRGGIVHADTDPSTLDPEGRLFSLEFSKPWQCAEKNADELAAAIEAVCRATGSSRVDVVGHSMGAVDARVYLDRGGDRIGKLAMVAPPNHGTLEADISLWIRDNLDIPVYPSRRDPDVREALLDLRADAKPSVNMGEGNSFLHDLNHRWAAQKAHTMDVAIVVGGGVPTPEPDGSLTVLGDGFVPWSSSGLPGIPMRYYCNPLKDTHGRMLRHARVAVDIANFLTGQGPDRFGQGGDGLVLTFPSA